MPLNTKPPGPPKAKKREIDDVAFDRLAAGAIDAPRATTKTPVGKGRPAKTPEKERGKGYAMGHKRQITHMIAPDLLDEVDEEAALQGEARATVINRYIREGLARVRSQR